MNYYLKVNRNKDVYLSEYILALISKIIRIKLLIGTLFKSNSFTFKD